MARRFTLDFLRTEAASGVLLAAAAAVALALANSPWAGAYFRLLGAEVPLQVGAWRASDTVAGWVRDGLMAVVFFVVGLEIKFEVLKGELSNPRRVAMPVLAALGGMVAPAALYLLLNQGPGGDLRGWSAPVATDVGLALAVFAAVGRGLPASLRVFLMTLAIVDDLGAVAIIALAYSRHLHPTPLIGAALALAAMAFVQRGRRVSFVYPMLGFLLAWGFARAAGVSPSLAGVAAAFTVPAIAPRPGEPVPLKIAVEALHPWVAFLILPLFAFTSAGVSFGEIPAHDVLTPVSVGVALGLFLGKPAGVFGGAALAAVTGLARRPGGATWAELYGVSVLCGVGFTFSLFLGGLAFGGDPALLAQMKLGVICGSLLSGLCGAVALGWAASRRRSVGAEPTPYVETT
ncbi:Na+/H+ antiporter NhaA [Caulobacter sp. 17J80-11]|uniref:Na+/H+ antiporter NhaA n=1 Tax=Caulobacter sp. 17J80-11 TaxID=2763502 RepID=UPI0016539448|nr:Na+/H+ antiporter NhaA [Caulobacter sp. 17J80-11]MBC6980380.1 Na+/H+ antiporter NhaA [Caulobacter sp. 17J80-11]